MRGIRGGRGLSLGHVLAMVLLVICSCGAVRAEMPAIPSSRVVRPNEVRPLFHQSLLARSEVLTATDRQTSGLPRENRRAWLGVILPWLYFLASSINLTTLPKFVNHVINGNAQVSANSARVYGIMGGLDALFTFLSVNYVGLLSDRFGRKPFMIMASLGLGCSHLLMTQATSARWFFAAAVVDGLTSCMLSQAQALVADCQPAHTNLSIALSKFQGIAIGLAFMLGVPLGGWISSAYGIAAPLKVSTALCMLNGLLIFALLPNRVAPASLRSSTPNWLLASPLGALRILTQTRRCTVCCLAYLAVCLAHAGMQSTWVNYLAYRFNWSTARAGATLVLIGLAIAVLPPLFIPVVGTINSVKFGIATHALALAALAFASSSTSIFLALPFVAVGSSVMPILLGYMTEQVSREEIGALQGACETVRTLANAVGSPLFAQAFAFAIKHKERLPPGLALICAAATTAVGGVFFAAMEARF